MDTKKVGNGTPSAVDAFRPQGAEQAGATSGAEKSKKTNKGGKGSSENYDVNLSPKARELMDARRKATDIAKQTPDIRPDRVAEMRAKIQNGSYQVQPERIADGMLQEAMRDEVAMQMHEEAKGR